ncbi:PAS domain-containing sensor histidine kinase [Methanolobus bombayensis]|uniref:PAS domain-containing sensor histidine kinase n=1 Tax=Methanolobus bombayensis TaxID=38023 RepID=UPI001AE7B260|nr:PAS domain-containing sensor histidine kinase [Methanolobus bombayensis]MBP1908345.1 PAS domain S-box-containing protein [Methanolobus bombayensis]
MNGYTKNNESVITNVTNVFEVLLNEPTLEKSLKLLTDRVKYLFNGPEFVSIKIGLLGKECKYSACANHDMVLVNDIVINGKNNGFIELSLKGLQPDVHDNRTRIEEYEKILGMITKLVTLAFEKREEIVELKTFERKLRDCYNKLEDYIFMVDNKGNIVDFNVNFETCTGHSSDELHKMNISELINQCVTNNEIPSIIEEAAKKGRSECELEHLCRNGEKVPMNITCKPLDDDNNDMFICVGKDISETKIVEQELLESEKKYSTIVEKGNDGVLIIQDGIIKFANSKMSELTGYTLEEIVNQNYMKFSPSNDEQKASEWMKLCSLKVADKKIFDMNITTRENENISVEINGSLIDYEGKKAELLIIRDISQRKRTEELLKIERDKLYNYLDVAGSIIGIVNPDQEVIFVNNKGAEVLGYDKDEIIGKKWFDNFLPESVRDLTKSNFVKVINHELDPPQYFENFILTKDGEERLIFWHDVPVEDENGKRIGVISSGEDITENRRMESMLIESENNLKTVFNNVDDLIYICSPYGNFIDANRAMVSSTGYTREEMLEMSPDDIVKPEMKLLMDSYTERIMKEKGVIFEISFVLRDGSVLPLELNSRLIEYKGEKAILSVARNITERKKAEERLKRYASELKKSNELKDLFTDIIRHDLLTPASVVKGYTEELLDTTSDEQSRMLAQKVKENNDRLIEMLETATKLAKLQKEEDIGFEKIDVVPVFKMVIDSFRETIETNDQTVNIYGISACPAVANPIIEEVFANLLSNAIKYSPLRSAIDITFKELDRMWKVTVTDRGAGISDSDKVLLFNRFQRADKKGIKGTGLGLAIVKRIIELHDGEYGVEDNPEGKGSVFWITLKKAL